MTRPAAATISARRNRPLMTLSRRRGSPPVAPAASKPPMRLPADKVASATAASERSPCASAKRGDRHLHAAERNPMATVKITIPRTVGGRERGQQTARVACRFGALAQGPVGDESEHADEAEDAGGRDCGIRREQRGQHADDQRADHEQQLLQRCLERICGWQLLFAFDHRRPQHPHGRPDRREHGAGERGGERSALATGADSHVSSSRGTAPAGNNVPNPSSTVAGRCRSISRPAIGAVAAAASASAAETTPASA